MKRHLVQILCGLAVVVFVVSLSSRISTLEEQSHKKVDELRDTVHSAVANLDNKADLDRVRVQIMEKIESKIGVLEKQVAQASFDSTEAKKLQDELGETRREAALVKAQLKLDISRTQETVDAYHDELKTSRTSVDEFKKQARKDIAMLAEHFRHDPETLSTELLLPAVQLNGDDTVGSGTLIYSGVNKKTKKVETYVITSYHVVRNILADTPRAKRDGIAVTIYKRDSKEELRCDIVTHDARIDAALLKLRGSKKFQNVARVIAKDDAREIQVWDPVTAVGCPLGNDPIPSHGEVSSLRNELNGANYWMINAPTYFGNSGGGVYLSSSRELAGVFSKIYTHGRGNPVVIPHMGLFTPMPLIYKWLEKEKFAFVLSNATAPARKSAPRIDHLMSPAPR